MTTTSTSPDHTPKRAALLYIRTRTLADTPAAQLHALRQLSAHRGWRVVGEFLDLPTDGSKQRDALLAEVHRGLHADGVLVCRSLSQLTMSVRDAVQILNGLLVRGWDIVTTDGIETSNKSELTPLIATLAALDRTGVSERARAALAQSRHDGKQLGRKRIEIPFKKVRDLLDAGRSWRDIARATGISVGTLHRSMRSSASKVTPPLSIVEAA